MNPIHRMLLRDQIDRDTVWCLPCGMAEQPSRRADVRYTVGDGSIAPPIPACRECFLRQLATPGNDITSSEPVIQTAYIAILERALDDDDAAEREHMIALQARMPTAQEMYQRTIRPLT